jgi:hypothetical protein
MKFDAKKTPLPYNALTLLSRMNNRPRLSDDKFDAILCPVMLRRPTIKVSLPIITLICALFPLISFPRPLAAQTTSKDIHVELAAIEVDPKRPERKNFGALPLLSAFHLQSKDKRFGGLSGLSIGKDGKLYAVSDRGYWLSASMVTDKNGALRNLTDWQIAPILTTVKTPVTGKLRDAEALAQTRDGSFLVGFEGTHRIWRYSAPPNTFASTPIAVPIPSAVARAPGNGGIEGLTTLPDGRLLILTEQFENPDGSFKGWLLNKDHSAELSYLPAEGFRITDCAALDNGDVLVLERRYVPFAILSARVTRVDAKNIQPGAKLAGRELLKLEQPLAAENFEGIAVQQTSQGATFLIVSDDNYSTFQQTLLLQFLLPNGEH